MLPIVDSSDSSRLAGGPEMTPTAPVDPVRVVVHAMLALYLSPVILVVCAIGATSILARGAARVVDSLARGGDSRPTGIARLRDEKTGPRLIYRRRRSRSAR